MKRVCCFDLCGPGGDLLSRALRHSTMGAEAFHGRVRDGIGWGRLASATGPAKIKGCGKASLGREGSGPVRWRLQRPTGRRATWRGQPRGRTSPPALEARVKRAWIMRAIKPIERLVLVSSTRRRACTSSLSTWSSSTALIGRSRFEVGFPLRCLQRLSRPYIATLHCGWRHNRSTRGTSIPVLSY